jgi:hypothetical protein
MSLGIVFKGAEGIVLAADSRVTLMAELPNVGGHPVLLPATFDNATKLLQAASQSHVGAVTYGAGAIGQQEPRTAASFLPEFDSLIAPRGRLSVLDFATALSDFFAQQWTSNHMPTDGPLENDMVFVVGGYDEGATYGHVFEFMIPHNPTPFESVPVGQFGARWGGQREIVDRLIQGYDPRLPSLAHELLHNPTQDGGRTLDEGLRARLQMPIPWQFLPLQDCVDLSVFLIRTTIQLQQWLVGVRGVGGAIDVATVTRTEGFRTIQVKQITGDKTHMITAHKG